MSPAPGRRSGRPPLLVEVSELLRRQGSRRRVVLEAELDGLVTSTAEVSGTVEVDVELEGQGQQVMVDGVVRAPWRGACRRCLEPVHEVVELAVREVYEPRPVEGETYLLDRDEIDLAEMVREVVLLALPLAPLCDTGCAGPDPDRFPAAAEAGETTGADDTTEAPARDPRWAALDQLDLE